MAKRKTAAARTNPEAAEKTGVKGKRVAFDIETWQALDVLARERMMTFQEVADEAFRDVLKKHGRPTDVRDALKKSARAAQAEAETEEHKTEKQKPAGKRRARSK